ncbi:MAG: hypothetical protein DRQ78_06170 [Epsilonproteobacteria bacterium]|nr:MAG: hypothetical protein DRQ78_06170 [Campylobacterota bacterium]
MASKVKSIIAERDSTELEYREEINPFNDIMQCFGILCDEETIITGGSLDPSVSGFVANIGSAYFSSNGNLYKKTGALDTDWTIFSGGGSGNVPDGGAINQVLMKLSGDNGDFDWRDENNNLDGGTF